MPKPHSTTSEQILALHDLSGGIHTEHNPTMISDNAAPYMKNLVYKDGYLCPRPGTREIDITAPATGALDNCAIVWFDRFIMEGTTSNYGGGYTDTFSYMLVYNIDSASVDLWYNHDDVTGTGPFTFVDWAYSLSNGTEAAYDWGRGTLKMSGVVFNEKLYIAGWSDDILIVDHSVPSLTDLTTVQTDANLRPGGSGAAVGHMITATPSRLFTIARNNTRLVQVCWSDYRLPTVWNGPSEAAGSSGSQQLVDSKSQKVTALVSHGTRVAVFTKAEMYLGVPDQSSTYKFEKVLHTIGCTGHNAITHITGGVFCWISPSGIYIGRLGEPPQNIGNPVRRFFEDNFTTDIGLQGKSSYTITGSTFEDIFDKYPQHIVYSQVENVVHIFIEAREGTLLSNTQFTRVLTFDLDTQAWYYGEIEDFRVAFASISSSEVGTSYDSETIFLAEVTEDATDAGVRIFEFATTDDDGAAFTCTYKSKIQHFLNLSQGKFQQGDIQKMRVISDGDGPLDLSLLQGNNWDRMTETTMGTQTMDNDASESPEPAFYLSKKTGESSEYFQLKIEGESDTFPRVAGAQVSFIPRGDTKQQA